MSMTNHTTRGFTLIEMIFYVVLFTILFAVIAQTLFTISGTHDEVTAIKSINDSASLAMERMVRDTRAAHHVITSGSSLATSTGILKLALTSDKSETRTFKYSQGEITLTENGTKKGALTGTDADITSLTFHHITSGTTSEAVKIEFEVQAESLEKTHTHRFFDTAILRGSFK